MRNSKPRQSGPLSVEEIAARLYEEARRLGQARRDDIRRQQTRRANLADLQREWSQMQLDCGEVPDPLTVEVAHQLVQVHRNCPPRRCRCREAALDILEQAGHYVSARNYDAAKES